MADCPNLVRCPFFSGKMEDMPTISVYLMRKFCRNDYTSCARFMIFNALGKEWVPKDLFPNEPKRAYAILTEAGYPGGER